MVKSKIDIILENLAIAMCPLLVYLVVNEIINKYL